MKALRQRAHTQINTRCLPFPPLHLSATQTYSLVCYRPGALFLWHCSPVNRHPHSWALVPSYSDPMLHPARDHVGQLHSSFSQRTVSWATPGPELYIYPLTSACPSPLDSCCLKATPRHTPDSSHEGVGGDGQGPSPRGSGWICRVFWGDHPVCGPVSWVSGERGEDFQL